ncbi:UDP-2,3-diacylglucosamine diphosphatase [Flavobacteriaceae bacterium Ap0902]|nr:UDP-2,3-diacylglucosamine diphosphatase [Flavobacteriaceae bacterium Ap0902]
MDSDGPIEIYIQEGKRIYFASDQHLGAPSDEESAIREKKFVQWLNQIQPDCQALFLLGDLFDFWFEYKEVVPKGFVRTLGKLAEFTDNGIPLYFFVGNHDLWMKDYLEKEIGVQLFRKPQVFLIQNKKFLIGHGDGLGPGDIGYKRMKKVFTNPLAKKLFYLLHPDFAVWLGKTSSRKNKYISGDDDNVFLGEENEWLVHYCRRKLETTHYDYFIFGHRHLPLNISLESNSTYINLGDWVNYFTYAIFDGEDVHLLESDIIK